MAADVVAAAVAEAPVCLATYGHPWVYCYPTTLITRAAALLDLHVEVFPGISAFDAMLVDLGVDIAQNGIQMYEASDVLLRRRPLQTDVDCIIWQPTVVGDPTCPAGPYAPQQFEPLQRFLLEAYPADHTVHLVTSKYHPMLRSQVSATRLADLARSLAGEPSIGTLYLPALSVRPIQDEEMYSVMVNAGAWPDSLLRGAR